MATLSSQLGWQQVCFKVAAAEGVGVAAVPCSAVAQAGRQPAGPSGKIITLVVSWHQHLSTVSMVSMVCNSFKGFRAWSGAPHMMPLILFVWRSSFAAVAAVQLRSTTWCVM